MELSTAQHQEMATSDSLENMLICTEAQQEMKKPRPQQEQALKCPRCDSTNTKFCYYNNYSLIQPRYFCKSCRRYWTNGGTLRNVPVGGSCRKNKRSSSSKRSANSNIHQLPPQQQHHHHQPHLLNSSSDTHQSPFSAFSSQMSSYEHDHQLYPAGSNHDLSHVFSRLQKQACGYEPAGEYDHHNHHAPLEHNNLSLLVNYPNNNTHFGNIMGLSNAAAATTTCNNNISGHGFFEGLKDNLLNNHNASPTNFHNLYYGFGNNNNSGISNMSGDNQIMIPYEDLSSNFVGSKNNSALKQEDQLMNDNNRQQVLWGASSAGFPWHQNNMVNDNMDLVRENINNVFAAPVWHGLLNSPLM